MVPFLLLIALPPLGPLDRLVGDWTSLESVDTPAGKRALRLKGRNRWVFEGRMLEVHEDYTVDGDPAPGRNHILLRDAGSGKLTAWWFVPDVAEPLTFDGTVEESGMTLTRRDGRMRLVYRWDGPKAYDARLQTRKADEESWADRTVARYTKG